MSSHKTQLLASHRIFIGATLVVSLCTCISRAQPTSGHKPDCTEYYEERVLYLLHCCGDVQKVTYPGPRFTNDLSDNRRADLALYEINTALRICNEDQHSPTYLSLQLDSAGAELMKARSVAVEGSHPWKEAGTSAESAVVTLKRFYREHRPESASVWKVIEHWLNEGGGPWQALQFVNSLPAACCSAADLARTRGDLFTEVGLKSLAAKAYSEWINIEGSPSSCGNEVSSFNVGILRKGGFDLPVLRQGMEAFCIDSGYGYYVILPHKKPGENTRPAGAQ